MSFNPFAFIDKHIQRSIACGILVVLQVSVVHAKDFTIGIIVFDGVLTSDVTAPAEVFGAASKQAWFSSYEVELISSTRNKMVKSEEGLTMMADHTIYEDIQLDVLLVASAYDMEPHLNNSKLIDFIEKHKNKDTWLASNCSGAMLLGKAGVLDNKKATTWAGGEGDLEKAFPKIDVQYDQNVVVDGKVITSNGGPVSYQAAFELLTLLSSEKYSQEVSELIQFNRLERAF